MKNKSILFVGTFLSSQKGTQPIAEHIQQRLKDSFTIRLVSRKKNKVLRLLDIIASILWLRPSTIVIDVFSGQALWIARITSTIARCIPGTKLILNLRGGKLAEYFETHASQITSLFNKADTIITPSGYLQSIFQKHGFEIGLVRNFVNLNLFEYKREHVKPLTLLWVRAFNTTYNPHIAVEILSALRAKGYSYTLTMVGPDDGLLTSTQQLAQQLGVDDAIQFVGPVPQTKLPEFYQTHSIYLNTTSYESFGNALLEAASCGIPFVSNSVGEIPFIWKHQQSCLLVENNNVKQFTDSIIQLHNQASLADSISLNARQKAVLFTWEHVANDWKNLLS